MPRQLGLSFIKSHGRDARLSDPTAEDDASLHSPIHTEIVGLTRPSLMCISASGAM